MTFHSILKLFKAYCRKHECLGPLWHCAMDFQPVSQKGVTPNQVCSPELLSSRSLFLPQGSVEAAALYLFICNLELQGPGDLSPTETNPQACPTIHTHFLLSSIHFIKVVRNQPPCLGVLTLLFPLPLAPIASHTIFPPYLFKEAFPDY